MAAVVFAVAPAVLRESRHAGRPRLDVPGAVTVTLGLLALVYGLTTAGERSFGDPRALAGLAAGAVLLSVFWMVERRATDPLVPVAVLRRRTVAWGNAAGLLAFATETSLVFLLTLYLQKVLGYTPLSAGLAFGVLGIGTVLGGVLGPRLIGAFGARRTIVGGLAVQAAATAPLVLLGSEGAWIWLVLATTFVGGIANLAAIVGFMVSATSGLPDDEQGLATGLATMSQQVGITLGVPVMSAIVATRLEDVLSAVTLAIGVNAALCLLAALAVGRGLR